MEEKTCFAKLHESVVKNFYISMLGKRKNRSKGTKESIPSPDEKNQEKK